MGERKAVAFVYFWEGVKGQEAEVTMGDLDPKQTERAMWGNGESQRLDAGATVEHRQGGLELISWNYSIHTSTQDEYRLSFLGTFSFIQLTPESFQPGYRLMCFLSSIKHQQTIHSIVYAYELCNDEIWCADAEPWHCLYRKHNAVAGELNVITSKSCVSSRASTPSWTNLSVWRSGNSTLTSPGIKTIIDAHVILKTGFISLKSVTLLSVYAFKLVALFCI